MNLEKPSYLSRLYDFEQIASKKSFFLFGPRQTGKTTSLKRLLNNALMISLLDPNYSFSLLSNPILLKEIILGHQFKMEFKYKIVIIDEIQKMPQLLDLIHLMIEEDKNLHFILTGSSVRKLRRSGVNLLGGRVAKINFFPFTSEELRDQKNWKEMMLYGGLPPVILSETPWDKLRDYVDVYLKEEIMAEALSRNLVNFSKFLQTAAMISGEQLNFVKVASDAQIPARTVKDYFQILEETLVGILLEPYQPRPSRKFVSIPKFYFFDPGIVHYLLSIREISPKSIQFGKSFEHFIFCELYAYLSISGLSGDYTLHYWRTQTQLEVDFILKSIHGDIIAIEVKGGESISSKSFKGLKALEKEVPLKRKIIVSNEKFRRITEEGIEIVPIQNFLDELWHGSIIDVIQLL